MDNKELTPFWSLFLRKSEPPGFWPRWGYLAFNFASSAFSGLNTLSSISWKTVSDTVSETSNNVYLCRTALQVIHPHAHCCYQVSITIIWLDIFKDSFSDADSNCRSSASHFRHLSWRCWRCHTSLSKKSNLNYSILNKKAQTKLFSVFFCQNKGSTKNKYLIVSKNQRTFFPNACFII